MELFLGFGMQEGNIVGLREMIVMHEKKYSACGQLKDLVEIFMFFLTLFQRVTFKKVEYGVPDTGEEYDERFHVRTADSSVTGKIKEVILPGFSIGTSISKKALVRVG